jgi:hypothetical protein
MITFRQKGDFSKLSRFLERAKEAIKIGDLDKYGRQGVDALKSATPKDTGKTADSWTYSIVRTEETVTIEFHNTNLTETNIPIAILLQYGHATKNGGFVQGIDYINPAVRPIFQQIADEAWREVRQ